MARFRGLDIRKFLIRRRDYIRSRVYGSRRGIYFISDGGLDREAAKGWAFAVPLVFASTFDASLAILVILAAVALLGILYSGFALYVGWQAYIEKSDKLYDRRTKYNLPPEYRDTESATKAWRRKRRENK